MAQVALPPPISWPLLAVPDAAGRLSYPSLEASVRQSIEIILRTRPGERLMRTEFGAGLEDLLEEPNTLATRRRIRDLVTESLERWERRLLLDRVEVWEVPEEPARVRVEIAYRLRRTGAGGQVHLTMELGG
ncbi:MAG: GPW/gp25 family protein [bacterium]|nr:GPW/gp25 family protein [bacterium]